MNLNIYISSWFSLINRVHFFSVRKLLVVVRHEVRPMHGSWPWIPHSLIIRHVERHPQTHRCMWEIAHLHSSHMLCQNWWDRHSRADSTKQKSYCKLNVVHMQQRPKDLFFLSVVSKKTYVNLPCLRWKLSPSSFEIKHQHHFAQMVIQSQGEIQCHAAHLDFDPIE